MNRLRRHGMACLICVGVLLATPKPVYADFWGGDDIILSQILVQTIQQLTALGQILGTGKDTISFLRQINDGLTQAMAIMRTANMTMHAGALSQYQNIDQLLSLIREVYGAIPNTRDARMEELMDQTVAESVTLHNEAFAYADGVDPEAERIKDYAKNTSPLGAARLGAESLGVLIHVNDQILRTHAASLKVMSENLALMNRREKVNSDQFKMQYEGLSDAFLKTPSFQASSNLAYPSNAVQ